MAAKKSDPAQYTKAELRDKIKAEVTAGDKGGAAGQWSARKAQLVTREYEQQGGGYKQPRTEEQQSLKQWGEEKWTTSDGKPAKRARTTTRYLPKAAWDQLSAEERDATNRKKERGSEQGRQFVSNTAKAAKARANAQAKPGRETKAVAKKKAPTRSETRAADKQEAKRSAATAKQEGTAKKAANKPAVKSTAEADRQAAQKKKSVATQKKAAARTRKRQAERSSRHA